MEFFMLLTFLFPVAAALTLQYCGALNLERKTRNLYVGAVLIIECVLAIITALQGDQMLTFLNITDSLPILLQSDGVSRVFSLLFCVMWTVSAFFSFGYMAHEKNEKRYYVFYLLTLGALCALAYAGTLATMYLFFEMMTLLSVALVLHELTKEAIAAGMKYLLYSIAGATLGLLGIFFLTANSQNASFVAGGSMNLDALTISTPAMLAIIFVTIVGFATKAGMFPMHAWLPTAHPVAPAPASAVLSAVITKAGVLCVVRILYFSVGTEFLRGTWVQYTLLTLSLITVFMGSMMAFKTDHMKKRLAYSTVSQVSYILLGLFLFNQTAFVGSLLHVVFHSLIKTALFLTAGAIIFKTGRTNVSELGGIGKQMPVTLWCFTIAALGLIGIPPTGGFVSKWNLALGALSSGTGVMEWLSPTVLLISALLTAGYLLPITIHGFFPGHDKELPPQGCEPAPVMTIPLLLCAAAALLGGMFAKPFIAYFTALVGGIV